MSPGQIGVGHPHIDARVLDMAKIIAERIDRDPALLDVGRKNLERWRRPDGTANRARDE